MDRRQKILIALTACFAAFMVVGQLRGWFKRPTPSPTAARPSADLMPARRGGYAWANGQAGTSAQYPWIESYDPAQSIAARIQPPPGFHRVESVADSYACWLRHLPLKGGRPPVYTYNGLLKVNQDAHHAVIDLDVGERDLQQCADAIIRLRAEYLFAGGKPNRIHFNFTSGDRADFAKWATGHRPIVRQRKVTWQRSAKPDSSYASLRKYLYTVFTYAGTRSLADETHPVSDMLNMQIGDAFIQAGSPGHAVLVVDIAVHPITGKKVFLLAQSFMPAQQMHILRNNADPGLSPWYDTDFGEILDTPEWSFARVFLRRMGST